MSTATGTRAAQRRLELVMVRIDETGHHDAAADVDHAGAGDPEVRPDAYDLLALDQNVGFNESPTWGSIDMT